MSPKRLPPGLLPARLVEVQLRYTASGRRRADPRLTRNDHMPFCVAIDRKRPKLRPVVVVLHLVPDLDRALVSLAETLRPGGKLLVPTFVHGETALARTVSRLARVIGFPVRRQLTTASLRAALERHGLEMQRAETIPGLLPIAFEAATSRRR